MKSTFCVAPFLLIMLATKVVAQSPDGGIKTTADQAKITENLELADEYFKSGSPAKGNERLENAALAGSELAMEKLIYRNYWGVGQEKDIVKAVFWANIAKKTLNPYAIFVLCATNTDSLNKIKQAQVYADQGNPGAMAFLGDCYLSGDGVEKDEVLAVWWFRKAANMGFRGAQCLLGRLYENGRFVTKDYTEAVAWYRKAAEQGDALAQFNLGMMYFDGEGVTKDKIQAIAWARKSADQGYSQAQLFLATRYYYDQVDFAQAFSWYSKAATQGDAMAQHSLGQMYETGQGVTKDNAQAIVWYRKAAAQGYNLAKDALKRLDLH